jgi:hypothetical protein
MSRADDVRRKLALYREYLANGVDPELTRIYLREITRLESELSQIESDTDKRR